MRNNPATGSESLEEKRCKFIPVGVAKEHSRIGPEVLLFIDDVVLLVLVDKVTSMGITGCP